ncbi:MAG: hypothetical protein JSS61_05450 [Verrucomicrobia bacterium]|nr:hypothetical protein [Verrucomicrobiota bacterium]
MRWSIALFLVFAGIAPSMPSFAVEEIPEWRLEIEDIDRQINELQSLKDKYLAAARRHEAQGQRWQFQNLKQEARKAYEEAQHEREVAEEIQSRIDGLNARKQILLEQHASENSL